MSRSEYRTRVARLEFHARLEEHQRVFCVEKRGTYITPSVSVILAFESYGPGAHRSISSTQMSLRPRI